MDDLKWCIDYLMKFNNKNEIVSIYDFNIFRALLNITIPINLSDEFYERQDKVLKDTLSKKEIVDINSFSDGISIYKGDITLINSDAIVNACNKKMLGCFVPGHFCIDNAIHTFAGLEVRRDMIDIMAKQGHDEENGKCKVTDSYNLPSKYIFHTVGPIYNGSKENYIDLENCYLSCLRMADNMGLSSIVFCSLSTGVFGFPVEKASSIAINTVKNYLKNENKNIKKVIFDVFSDRDYLVYKKGLNV